MTALWILLAVVLGALVAPYAIETRRKPVDGALKSKAPGQFVGLSMGATHYQWRGPLKGQVAVCIHGLTTPSHVWEAVANDLAHMGFRVLTYDLYGRGYSDRPTEAQTESFFLAQLTELLDALGVRDNLLVLGYSMGGGIATAFADTNTDRIDRLVLFAPSGFDVAETPLARFVRTRPFIGDWLMLAVGARVMRKAILSQKGPALDVPDIIPYQLEQLDRKGFLSAVLSSRRFMLIETYDNAHRRISASGTPVLAFWGERDEIIPLSSRDRLVSANPLARQVVFGDGTHAIVFTHAKLIQRGIQAFLREVI